MSRAFLSCLLLLVVLPACDERRASRDAFVATDDAPSMDAPAPDAPERPDSGRRDTDLNPDAALDAAVIVTPDAGMDASVSIDAARTPDAFTRDAPASSTDANSDTGVATRTLACAPIVPPEATAGMVFSTMFWPGFRFEATTATRATRVGLQLAPERAGTFFAAIVRLTGPSDTPDASDLSGADVVARVDLSMPAAPRAIVVDAPVDVPLTAGWYALVFGTDAVGGTLPSNGGSGCVSVPGTFPFSIRQSDGMFILQGAEPHLFVQLSP